MVIGHEMTHALMTRVHSMIKMVTLKTGGANRITINLKPRAAGY